MLDSLRAIIVWCVMRLPHRLPRFLCYYSDPSMAFQNPIIPGFNPDPSILRTGNDYFIATSTFEFL